MIVKSESWNIGHDWASNRCRWLPPSGYCLCEGFDSILYICQLVWNIVTPSYSCSHIISIIVISTENVTMLPTYIWNTHSRPSADLCSVCNFDHDAQYIFDTWYLSLTTAGHPVCRFLVRFPAGEDFSAWLIESEGSDNMMNEAMTL